MVANKFSNGGANFLVESFQVLITQKVHKIKTRTGVEQKLLYSQLNYNNINTNE